MNAQSGAASGSVGLCLLCGRPLLSSNPKAPAARRALYHPPCKAASNFLAALGREVAKIEGWTETGKSAFVTRLDMIIGVVMSSETEE